MHCLSSSFKRQSQTCTAMAIPALNPSSFASSGSPTKHLIWLSTKPFGTCTTSAQHGFTHSRCKPSGNCILQNLARSFRIQALPTSTSPHCDSTLLMHVKRSTQKLTTKTTPLHNGGSLCLGRNTGEYPSLPKDRYPQPLLTSELSEAHCIFGKILLLFFTKRAEFQEKYHEAKKDPGFLT